MTSQDFQQPRKTAREIEGLNPDSYRGQYLNSYLDGEKRPVMKDFLGHPEIQSFKENWTYLLAKVVSFSILNVKIASMFLCL